MGNPAVIEVASVHFKFSKTVFSGSSSSSVQRRGMVIVRGVGMGTPGSRVLRSHGMKGKQVHHSQVVKILQEMLLRGERQETG